ncbi:MAG: efflux RND transporter periplasmic adaptor subunit [Myxococcales bacterium]|nr:efflux RND transporter periplasmic adaptor subunit [Myxococcales bacterium]
MHRLLPTVALGVTALALSALGVACSTPEPPSPAAQREVGGPAPVPVTVASVAQAQVEIHARLPAQVRGARVAVVRAREGGRVLEVAVQAGERVEEGAPLVTVDPSGAQAAVTAARAQRTEAQVAWAQARIDERRYRSLAERGAVSAREHEQMRNRLDRATAALRAAREGVDAAEARLGYAVVRAPMAGLVTERLVDPGDTTPPGAPLLRLSGGPTEAWVEVPGAMFSRLSEATPVRVDAAGRTYPARVRQLVGAADPRTHTHLVKLAIEGDDVPPVGAYATAVLTLGTEPRLTVPAAAIVTRAGLTGALVVAPDGRARFREVRPSERSGEHAVIAAGLAGGERVVLSPGPDLDNGAPLRVERARD